MSSGRRSTVPTEGSPRHQPITPTRPGQRPRAGAAQNPSSLSEPPTPDSHPGIEDTLRHPPGPACTACGSVAVAGVAGNYLCAVDAIDAMATGSRATSEETTTAGM